MIYPLKKISTAATCSSSNNDGGCFQSSNARASGGSTPGASSDTFASLRDILEDICFRLTPIWSGLVYEGSVISSHSLGPLCLISRIGVILSELLPSLDSVVTVESAKVIVDTMRYDNFLVSMFSGFPYALFESTVAIPGSGEELEAKHLAGMLNIAVCEATLLWCKQSQASKAIQTSTSNTNLERSLKKSKDTNNNSAYNVLETVHLKSTIRYVHSSLAFLNESLSNKALSPTALMTDNWDDHLQRLFHCISLEVLFLSEQPSNSRDDQHSIVPGDEEAIGHVLNDLCMLIRFSVDMLSTLSFSHANASLINRLTFILKSTVTCASHITASENLLWGTTDSATISKITLLTQTLSMLPNIMVDICRKSAATSSLSQAGLADSLSDSEYVVYIALSTLLLLLRRSSVCVEEEYTESDDEDSIDVGGGISRMQAANTSPSVMMWNTIVVEISNQIADIFAESGKTDDDLEHEDSIFANYSFPTRMILLDILYYCRFDQFDEVAEDFIVSVTSTNAITSIEQEKMLYLLFSRRSEMGVISFVSILMRGFETCATLINEKYVNEKDIGGYDSMDVEYSVCGTVRTSGKEQEEGAVEEALLLEIAELVNSSDWCVSKISATLYQCGSSGSPHLIVRYTLLALREVIAGLEEQQDETDLYCYSIGILSMLQTLLAPFRCKCVAIPTVDAQDEAFNYHTPADVDTVEGILYSATELMAEVMIKLLLARANSKNATSKMLALGFRLLREGEPVAHSPLCMVLDGLVTRWEHRTTAPVGIESEELVEGELSSEVYRFDVLLLVFNKVGSCISDYGAEELMSLLDFIFEIVQYWKLSEDSSFDFYKCLIHLKLSRWCKEKPVAENQKVKDCLNDIINFINTMN